MELGPGGFGSGGRRADGDPPFGLPVLAEVPELVHLLQLAVDAERLAARLVEAIIVADDHGLAPATTGVALEQWLAVVARSTGSDRRMLATAAGVCRRLPSLRAAFGEGVVSWSQVRAVALQVERLPRHLDDRIDAAVADAVAGAAGADPDALARVVGWVLAGLDDRGRRRTGAPVRDVLVLQPRLDGSGGRLLGDFGPEGFAVIDAATDPGPPSEPVKDRLGQAADPDRIAAVRQVSATTRAARLVDRCRRRRRPPGWLADAIGALHDVCSEPGCQTAAVVCDLDHARPWEAGGTTDVANLAPLCRTANRTKESAGWQTDQSADGAHTWHHPRSGLTTRTLPATWRPPPRPDGHHPTPTTATHPPTDRAGQGPEVRICADFRDGHRLVSPNHLRQGG